MAVPPGRPLLVGRDDDLALIASLRAEAASGRPRLMILSGEAGIGKSRLVAEAVSQAEADGAIVLLGGCLDLDDGGSPYLPLAEALRRLARSTTPEKLDRVLGPAREDLARVVPELGAAAVGDGTPSSALAADDRTGSVVDRARMYERFLGVLGRLGADVPALIVVEDVQWIDRATRDLITFLVRNVVTERLVTILTVRTDELSRGDPVLAWLAEIGRAPGAIRHRLDRLDRDQVGRQIAAIDPALASPELADRIWRRSEGNPFFVEALIIAGDGRDAVEPESLVAMLTARLAGLDAGDRAVIDALAVAGRPTDERLLAAVAGSLEAPDQGFDSALRRIIDRGIVRLDEADGLLRFRHELLREIVERALLPSERRAIHERFAELLEVRPELGAAPAEAAMDRARHWAAADRPGRAYWAALAAADAAEAVNAHADALGQLLRARQLSAILPVAERPSPEDEFAIVRRAADAADLAGDVETAIELTREALAMVDPATDRALAGVLHSRLGYLFWAKGSGRRALDEHREAVRLVPADPPSAERARVLGALAGALMGAGQWADSRAVSLDAIACAEAASASAEESRARNVLGSDLVALGEIDAGLDELRRARRMAAESGPPELLIVAHHNLALNLLSADAFEEALAEADAGRDAARATGLARRYGPDLAALSADVLTRLGRWDEAVDAVADGTALAPRGHPPVYLVAVGAKLAALRGDRAPASERLARIERADLDPDMAAFVAAVRAESALLEGRAADAAEDALEGLGRLTHLGDIVWSAPLVALGLRAGAAMTELALARRDASSAAAIEAITRPLLEWEEWLRDAETPAGSRAWAMLAGLEAAALRGDATPARWDEAVAAWERVGDPYRAAEVRLRRAEAALRAGGLRADVGDDVRAVYVRATELGARPLRDAAAVIARRARIDLSPGAAARTPAGRAERGTPVKAARGARGALLSAREIEVLGLVADGRSNGEIAERLYISRKTAAVHVTHILDKLGASNRVEAAMTAARLGFIAVGDPGDSRDQAPVAPAPADGGGAE